MKAFILDRYGGADRVRAGDRPDPELREDDVMVQIHAAGVNPLDSKIRSGEFKRILPYRLPLILGNEVAGVVTRVGSRVRRFTPGDEVYARPDHGGDHKEADVAHKPKALTMEEAAFHPPRRLDRLAGVDRTSESEEGAKGSHPRGLGWCRNLCHSTREAYWRGRRDDDEHSESRLGETPWCRYRDRLQEGHVRNNPA